MDTKLESLSATAGVDFKQLFLKYKSVQEEKKGPTQVNEDANKLDKYAICSTCDGQGYIQEVYNHMVLEKNCKECDGESIVLKKKVEDIVLQETES